MLPPRARRYFRLAIRQPEILESDVGEEIAFHIEQRIEQLIRLGVPPEQARDEALRRFGRLDVAQAGIYQSAQHRENRMRVRELLDALRNDTRQAVRSIRMSPG